MKVALAQLTSILLNQKENTIKIIDAMEKAAKEKADLIVFPEAFNPGYPFWIEFTDGAKFNSEIQKEYFYLYHQAAIQLSRGDLRSLQESAKKHKIRVVLGSIEAAEDRGGTSLYCTCFTISEKGEILASHRKVMPTYEERLFWSIGDGNGLQVFDYKDFKIGALNCWENWIPYARTAMYAQGETCHIAIWPGSDRNTQDITRFIAMESRSYVISVSSYFKKSMIPKNLPAYEQFFKSAPDVLANGGSCVANPDGSWLLEPQIDEENIYYAELDIKNVIKERHNFDINGHYSRPDIFQLHVNTERQNMLKKN